MNHPTPEMVSCVYCQNNVKKLREFYIQSLGQFCKGCWVQIHIDARKLMGGF